eukprot:TRINITY_DN41237_c0_g1_i1.p1 TRINITY_DN41237_c0_g1~~TRINITY_DN41237_c0_g1_i1.p1  ORF type:complete len:468 (-),score=79.82 TRINITY_DN41237_c0_g1_i1:23-1426(-)
MVSARAVVTAVVAWLAFGQNPATNTTLVCWCGGVDVRVASFNGALWIAGGYNGARNMSDGSVIGAVCPSARGLQFSDRLWRNDGHAWTSVGRTQPAWAAVSGGGRHSFGFLGCGALLWLLGGRTESGIRADVWFSTDGHDWEVATVAAAFGIREGFATVCVNERVIVLGGFDGDALLSDIWSASPDGATWTEASAAAGWSPRRDHAATVFNGYLWVLGGYDDSPCADVWRSVDGGVTWQQTAAAASFGPAAGVGGLSFGARLWAIGSYRYRPTQTFRPRPHQRHWSPAGSVVEVTYASRRLAIVDVTLGGGSGFAVNVLQVRPGGTAAAHGVKAGDRLVSVNVAGAPWPPSSRLAFEALSGGGVATAPQGVIVLGFVDPATADPMRLVVPPKWYIEYEEEYPIDVWSSTDGTTWTLESRHAFSGQAECRDAFAAVVAETGPLGQEKRLVVLNALGGVVYRSSPVYSI